MNKKLDVTANDVALAAFHHANALSMYLVMKGVLTTDEGNEIAAMAASMCKASDATNAAEAIYVTMPTSRDIDPIAAAEARGVKIEKPQ